MVRGVLDSAWTRRGGEHGAARTGPEGQRWAGNAGGAGGGGTGPRLFISKKRTCKALCISQEDTR